MKTIQKFNYLIIVILFAMISCQDGTGEVTEIDNAVICQGYNRHNHSESISREYTPIVGSTCLASSDCENLKQALITKAQGLATSYCRNYNCNDGDHSRCNGRFTLLNSTCSISSRTNAEGLTICTETVTINGVIDCYCE